MKSNTKIYVINALTNMHVGSGDVNYGVIDNLIQRDPITSLPNINASSLKGALREFYTGKPFIEEVFGGSRNNNINTKGNDSTTQGKVRFFEASLLSLPVRSDKASYLMATSVEVIRAFADRVELFTVADHSTLINNLRTFAEVIEPQVNKYNAVVFKSEYNGAVVEIMDLKASKINVDAELLNVVSSLFGKDLAIVSHEVLKELCDDNHLPVIARNNLENGQSKNLWYEQVLPKYSRLYFMLMNVDCSQWGKFTDGLKEDIFQIGANATIGYGFCKFEDVSNS